MSELDDPTGNDRRSMLGGCPLDVLHRSRPPHRGVAARVRVHRRQSDGEQAELPARLLAHRRSAQSPPGRLERRRRRALAAARARGDDIDSTSVSTLPSTGVRSKLSRAPRRDRRRSAERGDLLTLAPSRTSPAGSRRWYLDRVRTAARRRRADRVAGVARHAVPKPRVAPAWSDFDREQLGERRRSRARVVTRAAAGSAARTRDPATRTAASPAQQAQAGRVDEPERGQIDDERIASLLREVDERAAQSRRRGSELELAADGHDGRRRRRARIEMRSRFAPSGPRKPRARSVAKRAAGDGRLRPCDARQLRGPGRTGRRRRRLRPLPARRGRRRPGALPYSLRILLENLLRHEDGAQRHRRRHRARSPTGHAPRREAGTASCSSCRRAC